MIKKIIIPIIAAALFIVGVGILIKRTNVPTFSPSPQASPEASIVQINGKTINVSVAKTTTEREKGLSGVASLPSDSGMLFVFDDKSKAQVFWMKGMLIPIDIIWIKEGKVIKIDKNIPAPDEGTPDNRLKTYSAGVPVDFVLEVNSGFSDTNKIKVEDDVIVSGI